MLKFLVLHFTNTNTKGGKSVNSDHVPLEMDLDFKLIPKNQQELSYIRKGKYRLATPAVSCSGGPPWIQKEGGLESSGRIVSCYSCCVTLRELTLDFETGWTGELCWNRILLIFEN